MDTKLESFVLRLAEEQDISLILRFIKGLAEYEKMLDQVTATEEALRESLFVKKAAQVLIGEYEGRAVCFAVFFYNFSTFVGRPGLYVEDLYVLPEMRGRGIGKAVFSFLAGLAVERKCGRMEWACLNWNEPSIRFYKGLGAVPMDDWTVYRVGGAALTELAGKP